MHQVIEDSAQDMADAFGDGARGHRNPGDALGHVSAESLEGRRPQRRPDLPLADVRVGGVEGVKIDEVIRRPSPRNPLQRKTKVEVKVKRTENETYVLCISDGRKNKDRAIREKHEQRLRRDLDKLQARVDSGRLTETLKIGEAIGRLKERYPRVARPIPVAIDLVAIGIDQAAIGEVASAGGR